MQNFFCRRGVKNISQSHLIPSRCQLLGEIYISKYLIDLSRLEETRTGMSQRFIGAVKV